MQNQNPYAPYSQPYQPACQPEIATKWSWGAFTLSWMWGIGNGVWLALLVFVVPFWSIVLGIKGGAWAWDNCADKNVETFTAVQNSWNKAGFIGFIVNCAAVLISILAMGSMIVAIFQLITHTSDLGQQQYLSYIFNGLLKI